MKRGSEGGGGKSRGSKGKLSEGGRGKSREKKEKARGEKGSEGNVNEDDGEMR